MAQTPEDVLYGAQVAEPVWCLGMRLRPYCLGHHLILRRFGLIFESDTGEASLATAEIRDLLFGVFVCSQSYEESERDLTRWWLPIFLRLWRWRIRNMDRNREQIKFGRYIEAGCWQPDENTPKDRKLKWMGSPWEVRLKCTLMQELGYTETQVMNRPLALCRLDAATLSEMDGRTEMFNCADEALFAKVKELEAEEAKEKDAAELNGKGVHP